MTLSRLYNAWLLRLLRRADHVSATTPSYARRLARYVPRERVSVTPSGVDFERFYTRRPKPPGYRVLFVGQMRATKGLQVLLRAFQGVEGAHLDVVGTSRAEPRYRRLARALGLQAVTFHGWVPDHRLAELYAQAHVFVLPSITEGEAFGIVQLEAMAAGCVPVVSDLPGVRDVAGPVGVRFPPGDVAALRRHLLALRDDPAERTRRAALAPRWAARFRWEQAMRRYVQVYERVLAGQPVERPDAPFAFPFAWEAVR